MGQHDYADVSKLIRSILKSKHLRSNEQLCLKLIELEGIFKDTLISSNEGVEIYKLFVYHILKEKKNLVTARPYFRVRQSEFKGTINQYIRNNQYKKLMTFPINAHFISWALQNYNGPNKEFLETLSKEIYQIRNEFVTKNFPLILNRIKVMWHYYNQGSLPDWISAASTGAIIALDKYVPLKNAKGDYEYTSLLISTVVARIRSAANQHFSQKALTIKEGDLKKIIQIFQLRTKGLDDRQIAKKMGVTDEYVSSAFNVGITEDLEDYRHLESELENPSNSVESTHDLAKLHGAMDILSNMERKVFTLYQYKEYKKKTRKRRKKV